MIENKGRFRQFAGLGICEIDLRLIFRGGRVRRCRRKVREHWLFLANIIAVSLSTNLTFIIWQARKFYHNNKWLSFILMAVTWVMLFGTFRFISIGYLLMQWLVD
ncbi:hypothetical protein H6G97_49265 [Nostoc flagelliforme FACHB-838]|uniref:Transposase n=1 Tax=Nostoc flagelliforme FACHB-838 TaxID=2692904 RepID=A0ABR8E892_9NOSO|nr:hypothetical protein [Nostoc flagelliforme FACHB-838]